MNNKLSLIANMLIDHSTYLFYSNLVNRNWLIVRRLGFKVHLWLYFILNMGM